jgi:uncharacterized membrane protein YgaE (UPF0421/DUF939 family)
MEFLGGFFIGILFTIFIIFLLLKRPRKFSDYDEEIEEEDFTEFPRARTEKETLKP